VRRLPPLLAGLYARTIVPWQVAGELLNWLRKWEAQGRVSSDDAEAHLREVIAMFSPTIPGVWKSKRSRLTDSDAFGE